MECKYIIKIVDLGKFIKIILIRKYKKESEILPQRDGEKLFDNEVKNTKLASELQISPLLKSSFKASVADSQSQKVRFYFL